MLSFLLALVLLTMTDVSKPMLHIIGDSHACGVKPYAPVGTTVDCQVGSTTAQWVKKIDSVGIKPGDDVLIFLGTNDWWGKPDAKPLLAKLKGTNCVWVGPTLVRGKDGAAETLKKQFSKDETCRYLDSRKLNLKLIDGIHTSESSRWLNAALKLLTQS